MDNQSNGTPGETDTPGGCTRSSRVKMRFGHRLKLARARRGLTQTMLAAMAGVGQSTIQRAERAKTNHMRQYLWSRVVRALRSVKPVNMEVPE